MAVGGTFDHFHKGHQTLLLRSFELGDFVVIGVTSDSFAEKMGKTNIQRFHERKKQVSDFLKENSLIERARIVRIDDALGPLVNDKTIFGVVVTAETLHNAKEANMIRAKKKLPLLEIFVQDYALAEDGKPISSSRIRNKEIDVRGNLIRK